MHPHSTCPSCAAARSPQSVPSSPTAHLWSTSSAAQLTPHLRPQETPSSPCISALLFATLLHGAYFLLQRSPSHLTLTDDESQCQNERPYPHTPNCSFRTPPSAPVSAAAVLQASGQQHSSISSTCTCPSHGHFPCNGAPTYSVLLHT